MHQQHLQSLWEITLPENFSEQDLLDLLRQRIEYLLINDFSKLLNIMYRLDIPEEKFKQAMAENGMPAMADRIAQLVLEREIQKIKIRTTHPPLHDGSP